MYKKVAFVSVLMLAAVLLTACASGALAANPMQTAPETPTETPRTVSVNGSGVISLTPDIATISIGVHTEDEDATKAVAENNRQAQAVADALKAFGIDEKDIRTQNFSIYPQTQWGKEGERIGIIYVVDNTVKVTVRDLEKIGDVLNAVVEAGANNIYGIAFDVADRESAYQQALEMAVENAATRARILAEAAGAELGEVQSLSTYLSPSPYPVMREFAVAEMAADAASVPISSGEMTITVEVQAVYALK